MATLGSVLTLLDRFAQILVYWKQSGTEIRSYQIQAKVLREKIDSLKSSIADGNKVDEDLLKGAESMFQSDVERLEKQIARSEKNKWVSLIIRLKFTAFRWNVDKSLQAVDKALTDILDLTRYQKAFKEESRNRDIIAATRSMHRIIEEENYVPPRPSFIDVVKKQLESVEHQGVQLFGEAGVGKSCCATYIGSQYQDPVKAGEDHPFRGGVFRLECSDRLRSQTSPEQEVHMINVEAKSLIYKLLEMLCTDSTFIRNQARIDLGRGLQLLGEHLKESSGILIIIDEIYSRGLLLKLLAMVGDYSNKVKYLFTCREILHDDPKVPSISMYRLDKGEALDLLSRYAGIGPSEIPENCKVTAEKIVAATCQNPLALANLGMILKDKLKDTPDTKSQWDELLKNLSAHLGASLADIPQKNRPYMYGRLYPRSVHETIKLVFTSQSEGGQKLLLTVAMFDGPSVQEDVVHLLFYMYYEGLLKRNFSFEVIKSSLKGTNLLRCSGIKFGPPIPDSEGDGSPSTSESGITPTLSMYGLYRYFMLDEYENDIKALLAEVSEQCTSTPGDNYRLLLAVCACYGAKIVAVQADGCSVTESSGTTDYRDWLATFLTLLEIPPKTPCEEWPERSHSHAREIFLTFCKKGQLELNNAITGLLRINHDKPTLATCWAVHHYCMLLKARGDLQVSCSDVTLYECLLQLTSKAMPIKQLAGEILVFLAKGPTNLKDVTDVDVIDKLLAKLRELLQESAQVQGGNFRIDNIVNLSFKQDLERCLENLENQKSICTSRISYKFRNIFQNHLFGVRNRI